MGSFFFHFGSKSILSHNQLMEQGVFLSQEIIVNVQINAWAIRYLIL